MGQFVLWSAAPGEGFNPSKPVRCSGKCEPLPALSVTEVDSALMILVRPFLPVYSELACASSLQLICQALGFCLLPFPLAQGMVLGCHCRQNLSRRRNWMETEELCENSFKTWMHIEVLWNFPLSNGILWVFKPPSPHKPHSFYLLISSFRGLPHSSQWHSWKCHDFFPFLGAWPSTVCLFSVGCAD